MIKGFDPPRPRIVAAAVHTDAIADAAGAGAMAGRGMVRVCSHEEQLDECLTRDWVPVIVIELGSRSSPLMLSRVMRTPIVAVVPPGPLPISQILSLALSGARFELVHDAAELSAAIRSALSFHALDSEIGELARALSWRLDRRSLEYVVGLLVLGCRRTTISEALARLDRPADVRNFLREKSLPKPARLLGWGAALHLIWQMERYSRDFTDLSRVLGHESTRHCSDAFKFHTGYAAMSVIRGDGFAGIAEEFLRQVGGAAHAAGVSGRDALSLPA